MSAQAGSLQPGHTWHVRPGAMAVVVVAAFAVGLVAGRQPILGAADGGQATGAGTGSAASTPDRTSERDALVEFRAGERAIGAPVAGFAERDALILFRAAERSATGATVPGSTEPDALIDFRAAERASWAGGEEP